MSSIGGNEEAPVGGAALDRSAAIAHADGSEHAGGKITVAILAAAEAIIGLLIEISFIVTFTQRFLGK